MMNSNWMVVQAIADRKALIAKGAAPATVAAMDHREVCKELKRLGHDFKNQPKRNGHGCA